MKRSIAIAVMLAALLTGGLANGASGADLKVIQTQKAKDVVIALKSESGQWTQGKNAFVLEFTSPGGKPIDAGKVTLSTSMPMPGMAPMIAGATVTPRREPGPLSRHHQLSRQRHPPGDRQLGWSRGEGLGAVLGSGAVGARPCSRRRS